MNKQEYQKALHEENKEFRYKLLRNLAIPALGLLTSFNLFNYVEAVSNDTQNELNQLKKGSAVTKEFINEKKDALNKAKYILYAGEGIKYASIAGLVILPIFLIADYKKKKKALEKQLSE